MRSTSRALWVGLAVMLSLAAWSCSLLENKFNQCAVDSDCDAGQTCAVDPQNAKQHFCVLQTIPPGCFGLPDAGIPPAYGDLTNGTLHFGLTSNFTSATSGPNITKVRNFNAIQLALDQINAQQGTGNKTFVLHVCDTQGDLALLSKQVNWLINQWNVAAIIIPVSSQVTTAVTETTPAGVVVMSPTATSPAITTLGSQATDPQTGVRLVWRTVPSDELQGRVISDLLLGRTVVNFTPLPAKVGIVYTLNDPYGSGLFDVIQPRLAAAGVNVFGVEYEKGDAGSYANAVQLLAGFAPNASVVVAYPGDNAGIVNAAQMYPGLQVDAGHRWVFTDSAKDPSLYRAVSDPTQIANAVGTDPAPDSGPAYGLFQSGYESQPATLGVDPGIFAFTSYSFDAMYLLALGADYAVGTDGTGAFTGARVAEGLTRLSDAGTTQTKIPYLLGNSTDYAQARSDLQAGRTVYVAGASGPLGFNPLTGESLAPIEIWGVAGNSFVQKAVVQPPPF